MPPRPPTIRVHRVTSNSITLRWSGGHTGYSPVVGYRLRYKITYGEWAEEQVGRLTSRHPTLLEQVSFYSEEHTLSGLYCGRQYHMVMHQVLPPYSH